MERTETERKTSIKILFSYGIVESWLCGKIGLSTRGKCVDEWLYRVLRGGARTHRFWDTRYGISERSAITIETWKAGMSWPKLPIVGELTYHLGAGLEVLCFS